ncbi:SLATT domain-containing protein [Aquimarina longa]|uniref:SLATT domain-containing protein n=1 Tax=Aquimarina longa TaxID=1080221 RepID=UPI000780F143|nr:SLATT domain-containing protein [Aquimarina longa]
MNKDIEIIEKDWFESGITNEQVKAYIEYILSYKRKYLNWYLSKRKKARQNSWKHLLPALIFFGLSLILPLLTGIETGDNYKIDNSTFYALGYISLILSTLLLLADRLFIHSKSWIRYTITLNQIEIISSKYYAKWIINLPQIDSNIDGIIQLLNEFDNELKELIKTETDNWKDLFTGQLDEFNKQASDRLKSSEKKISDFIDESKNNSLKSNKVNLEIKLTDIKPVQEVKMELYLDEKKIYDNQLDLKYPKWDISNIFIGTYRLVFDINENGKFIRKDSRYITLKGEKEVHTELIQINTNTNNDYK